MKSIWKGSLSFGLINIPINVYPASEERELKFHMLHKKDLSPVHYVRICKIDGKEVPYKDIVKGFEYEKGQFVVVEEEDFKRANSKKTSTIEIQYFSHIKEIDPIYYEKPYYLEPDKKSQKAYQLLSEALKKSQKVAITHFVFRHREHVGVILPSEEGALILIQMRYHTEIRPFDLSISKQRTSIQELKMAVALINQKTQSFAPKKHHDTYVEQLLDLITQKSQGKKSQRKSPKSKISHDITDLMSLLQQSMENKAHKKTYKHPPFPQKKIQPRKSAL